MIGSNFYLLDSTNTSSPMSTSSPPKSSSTNSTQSRLGVSSTPTTDLGSTDPSTGVNNLTDSAMMMMSQSIDSLHTAAGGNESINGGAYGIDNKVRTIFVSGLPIDATQRELHLLFQGFYGYHSATLKFSNKTGKTTAPVGFVTFDTHQQAEEAMEKLQGVKFDPDGVQVLRLEFAHANTKVTRPNFTNQNSYSSLAGSSSSSSVLHHHGGLSGHHYNQSHQQYQPSGSTSLLHQQQTAVNNAASLRQALLAMAALNSASVSTLPTTALLLTPAASQLTPGSPSQTGQGTASDGSSTSGSGRCGSTGGGVTAASQLAAAAAWQALGSSSAAAGLPTSYLTQQQQLNLYSKLAAGGQSGDCESLIDPQSSLFANTYDPTTAAALAAAAAAQVTGQWPRESSLYDAGQTYHLPSTVAGLLQQQSNAAVAAMRGVSANSAANPSALTLVQAAIQQAQAQAGAAFNSRGNASPTHSSTSGSTTLAFGGGGGNGSNLSSDSQHHHQLNAQLHHQQHKSHQVGSLVFQALAFLSLSQPIPPSHSKS